MLRWVGCVGTVQQKKILDGFLGCLGFLGEAKMLVVVGVVFMFRCRWIR